MNITLCIDCGLTKAKLLLLDEAGASYGKEEFSTPVSGVRIETLSLQALLRQAVADLLAHSDIDPARIVCVTVSGHGNGLYAIGDDGALPVGYSSMFTESGAYLPERGKTFPIISQADWCGQPLPILSWIKAQHPQEYAKIRKIMFCKDLLRWFMTGSAAIEKTDASAAGLINSRTGERDLDLLRIYRLEDAASMLPPIAESDRPAGFISRRFSDATGLPEGVPVLGGLFDVNSCMLGSGVIGDSQYALIAGTWGVNAIGSERLIESTRITQCCRFYGEVPFVCIDSAPTSCTNLEWYVEQVMNLISYAEADRIVQAEPFDERLVYLPYLFSPMDMPNAQGGFIGLQPGHNARAMLRAVFEGIVFEHLYRLQKLQASGLIATEAVLSGGAANSPVFGQMFADVCGVNVRVPAQTQAGALGGAVLSAKFRGVYPSISQAVSHIIAYKGACAPQAEQTRRYRKKFARFLELRDRLNAATVTAEQTYRLLP